MSKDDKVLTDWKMGEEQLDKKKAKKFVWRTRLSISFTVVRILLIVLLFYAVYMIGISIFYDTSGKSLEFERFVTTLVETRYEGISINKSSLYTEVSPFLSQSTTGTIYRKIGDWEVVVGEVTANKRLFNDVYYSLSFNNKYLNEPSTAYVIPPDLIKKDYIYEAESEEYLSGQLAMIEDGYVVQAIFSTKEAVSPEELRQMLETYDVDISQMPVFGGELVDVDLGYSSSGDGRTQYITVDSLMLRPQTVYNEDNFMSHGYLSLTSAESLEESIDQFYKDMDWLIEHGGYYDQKIDEKRMDYIRENGIQVYGATVTGPIREIERLMQEEMFHQFQLGGIEVWNWIRR